MYLRLRLLQRLGLLGPILRAYRAVERYDAVPATPVRRVPLGAVNRRPV